MKVLPLCVFALMFGSAAIAQSQPTPKPAVCKADLKAWSGQKTDTLTINQIMDRMNEMYACADEAHHHRRSDKRVRSYLDEFYRIHTELADRAFDFLDNHGLKEQFTEEENGNIAEAQTDSKQ
ncbi:MAG TPA: hypothetical protein VIY69_09035 [Candidatus Acidoferrales bacterium]